MDERKLRAGLNIDEVRAARAKYGTNALPAGRSAGFFRELAAAFAEGFISAVKSGDFEQWRPLIPESRRGGLTAEVFARIRRELAETLGELREGTYFGVLRKGDLHDHLWKLSFVRDGKTRDALFLVRVFREKNAPPEIGGFGVKRF